MDRPSVPYCILLSLPNRHNNEIVMILDSRKNLRFAVISQAVDFTMKKKKIEHTRTMRNFLEPDLQSPFGKSRRDGTHLPTQDYWGACSSIIRTYSLRAKSISEHKRHQSFWPWDAVLFRYTPWACLTLALKSFSPGYIITLCRQHHRFDLGSTTIFSTRKHP